MKLFKRWKKSADASDIQQPSADAPDATPDADRGATEMVDPAAGSATDLSEPSALIQPPQDPSTPAVQAAQQPTASGEPLTLEGAEQVESAQFVAGVEQDEGFQQGEGPQPAEGSQPAHGTQQTEGSPAQAASAVGGQGSDGVQEKPTSEGFYARLKRGLSRTGSQFASGLGNLFLGKKVIDDELLEDLESQLLMSDVGIEATQRVIADITARVSRKELADGQAVMQATRAALLDIIKPCEEPLSTHSASPYVILVIGVNGAGKTTTIGKLAHRLKGEGKKVLLAAGDTFRAAAVEQLQAWGERNEVPVVAQHTGADSASVLYDGLQAAKARGVDVLIADTAGRLQNKAHLMDELEKVVRVLRKIDPHAPHETLLVLDAGTGQNAVSQAEQFDKAVGVSGMVLTKLDGTAKGGVIFAIAQKFKRPIRFIGVGERAEDLRPFEAESFIEALFDQPGADTP